MAPITLDTPPTRTSAPRPRKPITSRAAAHLSDQPRDTDDLEILQNITTNGDAATANSTVKSGATPAKVNGTPTKPTKGPSALSLKSPNSARATPNARGSTNSPQKKRRYIPGGPGGGGRYVDEDGNEEPVGGTGPGGYNYTGPRGSVGRENAKRGITGSPSAARPRYIRPERRDRARERTRTRTVPQRNARVNLSRELGALGGYGEEGRSQMSFSGTAMASMAAKADGGYKPREERGWEEFHPDLDTEAKLPLFTAAEVDGVPEPQSSTSVTPEMGVSREGSRSVTPAGEGGMNGLLRKDSLSRRAGRPPRDSITWASRVGKVNGTPVSAPVPRIAPLQNQNAKERLTLPQPSFRKVDTFDKFAALGSKIDRSMANVGYQDTELWQRPDALIKLSDSYLEDDLDVPVRSAENHSGNTAGSIGRVEYDMDEQDDYWLKMYNTEYRRPAGIEDISHELFEMTITKIEKEWHALEKRIPKPNPKPPQTQRPRSSSAAAVNGEPQPGEEQDSKCAICDDGDCENTNAIVFCDGCDLAVHQECYGVPFIPEGQWLCRKCQLIGRGIPTCIFCPNTDGGFKQTNSSRWAHLLCAMWIPEVSLGNHIFMEPVMDVEKVPKPRWKLSCYICQQAMGACIQCGNKNCYQAFHVTCARRARLFLKMKNSTGTLIELDGGTHLKAFCDKHCPTEYSKENDVARATREARSYYKQAMKGRIWADSQAAALQIAANHPDANLEQPSNEPRPKHRLSFSLASNKKRKEEPQKNVWKLPSGTPVIPAYVFDIVEASLRRFTIRKHREWVAAACKYWTLKRESRRGAALLKRLQLPMEPFSSMEITRRNFAAMGEVGRMKLQKRREFVALLVKDMARLREIADLADERGALKLQEARLEREVYELTYEPVARLLRPIVEKAVSIDKHTLFPALHTLSTLTASNTHPLASTFAHTLATLFRTALYSLASTLPDEPDGIFSSVEDYNLALKAATHAIKERKKLARKIIKAISPLLAEAVRAEADVQRVGEEEVLRMLADVDAAFEAALAPTPEEILGPLRQEREGSSSTDELAGALPPTSSYAPILPPGSVSQAATASTLATDAGEPVVPEIEMGDADAEGEDIDEDDIFTPIPATTREASVSAGGVGGASAVAGADAGAGVDVAEHGAADVKTEPSRETGGVSAGIAMLPPPPQPSPTPPGPAGAGIQPSTELPGQPPPPVVAGPLQNAETETAAREAETQVQPTPATFLTRGGLPWYLKEAGFDISTGSFPKERTPTPQLEAEGVSSPLSSPAPEGGEPGLPMRTQGGEGEGEVGGVGGVEYPSEAETVRLPHLSAPVDRPVAGGGEMVLDEPMRGGDGDGIADREREGSSSGGELSDMDDEELNGLGAGMAIGDGVVGIRRGERKRRKAGRGRE